MEVGTAVVNSEIIENAVKQVWEKEVVNNHLKPYINKWTTGQGVKMYHFRPEDRLDDVNITPKKIDEDSEPASSNVINRIQTLGSVLNSIS